jgi:hypothetical protein
MALAQLFSQELCDTALKSLWFLLGFFLSVP